MHKVGYFLKATKLIICVFPRKYNVDWIGREGLSPNSHEAYLTDLVNHFYKNVVKLIQRGVKKENIKARVH